LVSFSLIDKRFKIIKGYTLKIGNSKEDSLSVFEELPFISTKIDLALEYKCSKLIRAISAEQVWFFNSFVSFSWL